MPRRHVHVNDEVNALIEAARAQHGVSIGYLINRGITLAVKELNGEVGVRIEPKKSLGEPVIAQPEVIPQPKKTLDIVPTLSEDGIVWFGLSEMCEVLGAPFDEVCLQLDEDDTLLRGTTLYVASLGVNTLCAVAASLGVDGDEINSLQEWAERLSA